MHRVAALLLFAMVAGPAAAQPAPIFDLAAFRHGAVANSNASRFTCTRPDSCGRNASVTLRLIAQFPADPTLEGNRRRITQLGENLRRQTERFTTVETTDTTALRTCDSEQLRAEARLVRRDGTEYVVDGILFRGRTGVTLIASGADQASARRNYSGFLLVACILLEQHVALTQPRPAQPSAPPPATPPASPPAASPPAAGAPPAATTPADAFDWNAAR